MYLSLPVANGAFDMIQLGFLMVRHTHEDIDALFIYFSKEVITKQVLSFTHLMKKFNECTQFHPTPFLIQQVPNFKDFFKGYFHEGSRRQGGYCFCLDHHCLMATKLEVIFSIVAHKASHIRCQ